MKAQFFLFFAFFSIVFGLNSNAQGKADKLNFHASNWWYLAGDDDLMVIEAMLTMDGSLAGQRNFKGSDSRTAELFSGIDGKVFYNGMRVEMGGDSKAFPFYSENFYARTYWLAGKTEGLGIVAGLDMFSYFDNIHTNTMIACSGYKNYEFKALTAGIYLEKLIPNKPGNIYFLAEGTVGKNFLQGKIMLEQNFYKLPAAIGVELGFDQRKFDIQTIQWDSEGCRQNGVNIQKDKYASNSYAKLYVSFCGYMDVYARYDYKFSTAYASRNLGFTIGMAFDIADMIMMVGAGH